MSINPQEYVPISCTFHDLLESHAISRKQVDICFRDSNGDAQRCSATITDVFARDGADYLVLSTGETLRIDRLIEVDGATLADY